MTTHVKDSEGNVIIPRTNLYLVKRASSHLNIESPCLDSFEVTVHFDNGIEIKRWMIEVNSIHEFISKYGCCILEKDCFTGFYSITIYDDNVE